MKLYCVMTEMHRGLIIKLSPLYTKKIEHLNGLEVIDVIFELSSRSLK